MSSIRHLQIKNENKRKALLITMASYLILLILFFFISWTSKPVTPSPVSDLMEINLGNNENGDGEEQPLIKGDKTNNKDQNFLDQAKGKSDHPPLDDDGDADAGVLKKNTNNNKNNSRSNGKIVNDKKGKLTYQGPKKGENGNNDELDNGFKNQGDQKNKNGDNGIPNGDKDSYGDTEGGKIGGPKIIRGNRRIVQNYQFAGDLSRATIYASIKVTPSGKGSFIKFEKGSTNTGQAYRNAIDKYLNNILFNKIKDESIITVEFYFDVK